LNLTIYNNTNGTDTQTACETFTWIDGNTYTANNNTATYTIIGGNINGCDSIVTLDLTINTVDTSITLNDPVLSANVTGASYQWVNCPSMSPINGATDQSYTPTTNGSYAVIITQNACSDTSACYSIASLNIIENNFKNTLQVYPNPITKNFSVDLGESYGNITVTILDIKGKVIQIKTYKETQLLNLTLTEPAGVYLLMIETEGHKAIIRLIKE